MLIGDDRLSGKEAAASLTFSLPDEVRGKSIEFVIDIIDSAGNEGRAVLSAFVGLNGEIQLEHGFEEENPAAEIPGLAGRSGCAVRARTTPEGAFALFAITAFDAAVRRQRRTPRTCREKQARAL